jgi:DNA recombination protein RmuC
MDAVDALSLILGLVVGGGSVAVASLLWRSAATREQAVLAEQARALAAEVERLREATRLAEAGRRDAETARARAEAELEHGHRDATQAREALRNEFENLANRLFEEKGRLLAAEHRQGLEGVLTPLRDRLKQFEDTVTRTNDQENRDRASLLDLLKRLGESQVKLGHEAETLSRALSGESKVQGDWGEMILENLLQGVGLVEGREYEVQQSHTGEDGCRLRPDIVINLPDGKAVVIDSKVAITAFLEWTRADDPEVRARAMAAHAASIRSHIRDLAGKRYQDVLQARSLDFVILFVPSEPAFHAALAADPGLYDEAWRQAIVLASPTTLLATLKVVAHVWQHEKQNANAARIAAEAGKLLDKFVAFARELDQVGDRLRQAQESFDGAKAKLETGRGNLVNRAKALAKLGAKLNRADKANGLLALDDVEDADDESPG